MGLKFGGTTYPLAMPGNRNLQTICDPFVPAFLAFCQFLINHYCEAAYVHAMAGQAGPVFANSACVETTTLPPELYLVGRPMRLPLLALYPVDDTPAKMKTMRWSATVTRYAMDYVLPPLDAATMEHVAPILPAVRRLIVNSAWNYQDPNYLAGVEPLTLAGVMEIHFLSASYGFLKHNDVTSMPTLSMSLEVHHREDHDPTDDTALDQLALTVNAEGVTVFQVLTITPLGHHNMASLVLRLIAVDSVNVCDIIALESGIRRIVGKSFDAAREGGTAGWFVTSEPGTAVCAGPELGNHRTFYAKACTRGDLAPADADTATELVVPFVAPARTAAAVKPVFSTGGDK